MTVEEQLAIWAACSNDELFVWYDYPQPDEVFLNNRSPGTRNTIARMRVNDVFAMLEQRTSAKNATAADFLARFGSRPSVIRTMRVDNINGIACVIVEGKSPVSPHSPYRILFSSVAAFT